MPSRPSFHGSALLRSLGWLVIVVAGLRAAQNVLVPICVSALLAFAYLRPLRWLIERRVPRWVAAALLGLGAAAGLLLLTFVVERSIADYDQKFPVYAEKVRELVRDVTGQLEDSRFKEQIDRALDPAIALELIRRTLGSIVGVLSNLLVIVLLTLFTLLEAGGFPAKLRAAFGDDLGDVPEVGDKVFNYLFLKTVLSLLTGVLVTGLCTLVGLDFPIFWGLVAFLFNYIPTIGSIIAAIPAVLLGLVQEGLALAALTGLGYLAINISVGSFLEPRVMGRSFGLSTLVVFVMLLFWAWLWGPIGMLLAVPLTMVGKIILEHTDDYRFVAVLLDPSPRDGG